VKCFSAGHDLRDLVAGEDAPHPQFQAQTIEALANLPQPVIAAIHGHCYTGALELALAGDILMCGTSAAFRRHTCKMGAHADLGVESNACRAAIGTAKAREMMMTCATYTGKKHGPWDW